LAAECFANLALVLMADVVNAVLVQALMTAAPPRSMSVEALLETAGLFA
jgi:hypothetical protein